MAPLRLAGRAGRALGRLGVRVARFVVMVITGMALVFSLLVVLDALLLGGVRRPPRN